MKSISKLSRQSGLALIMVLLIVVMAGVIALDMVTRSQLDIRRTGNLLAIDQGNAYAMGAEPFVLAMLEKAFKDSDDWLTISKQALPDFIIPGGVLSVTIEDLQANYNLNSVKASADNADVLNTFELLMRALDLGADIDTKVISQSVVDWIDTDLIPTGVGGVEDDYYMLRDIPYRAGNTLFQDLSELRLIKGIDNETYATLESSISVLPVEVSININTASIAVIRTLSDKVTVEDAQEVINLRKEAPLKTLPEILKSKGVGENQVVFRSEYFRITSKAIINDRKSYLQSIIFFPDTTQPSQSGNENSQELKSIVLSRNQNYRYISPETQSDVDEIESNNDSE